MKSVCIVTGSAVAVISASQAELWVKLLSAAVPSILASAYSIWKWRKEAKKNKL